MTQTHGQFVAPWATLGSFFLDFIQVSLFPFMSFLPMDLTTALFYVQLASDGILGLFYSSSFSFKAPFTES